MPLPRVQRRSVGLQEELVGVLVVGAKQGAVVEGGVGCARGRQYSLPSRQSPERMSQPVSLPSFLSAAHLKPWGRHGDQQGCGVARRHRHLAFQGLGNGSEAGQGFRRRSQLHGRRVVVTTAGGQGQTPPSSTSVIIIDRSVLAARDSGMKGP